jgi:hypothetical protein
MLASAIFIILLTLVLAHTVYDYSLIGKKNSHNSAYNRQGPLKQAMVMVLLPLSCFLIPIAFYLYFGPKVEETLKWMNYFMGTILLAIVIGPSVVNLYYRDFKAAGKGLIVRIILSLIMIKAG